MALPCSQRAIATSHIAQSGAQRTISGSQIDLLASQMTLLYLQRTLVRLSDVNSMLYSYRPIRLSDYYIPTNYHAACSHKALACSQMGSHNFIVSFYSPIVGFLADFDIALSAIRLSSCPIKVSNGLITLLGSQLPLSCSQTHINDHQFPIVYCPHTLRLGKSERLIRA